VAAVLDSVGALLDSRWVAATAAGYQQLLGWALALGTPRRAGVRVHRLVRGGAAPPLAGRLRGWSPGVNQPDKATRRRGGKTDPIDAEAAARAVLAGRAAATATTGDGPVEGARLFKLATDAAVKSLHPGDQPAPRPCWWPPTQRCASRCLGPAAGSSSADARSRASCRAP
jgi:hypothetical protein